jgi:DNA polymerase-4
MYRELMRLCERTSARLRARSLTAGTVQLKVRQSDFATFTRQHALRPPGNGTDSVFNIAKQLLDSWLCDFPGARIRLLGVGGSELAAAAQGDLFSAGNGQSGPGGAELDRTIDEIRGRFGNDALGRARVLYPRHLR